MPTSVILAPNARWQGRDPSGNAIINGQLYTYKAHTDIPKATFQDPAGIAFNFNPIILDGKGEANVYWATDEYYRIELWTEGGKASGELVYTQNVYPFVSGNGGNVNVFAPIENLIRNPQFTFWHNTTSFPDYKTGSSPYDYLADEWSFSRNNNNATLNITRQSFGLGQTAVPANPLYFLRYECTNTGAGEETSKYFSQQFDSVQTLAGREISFAFWARSLTNSTISASAYQYFGSGGTPSTAVDTPLITATLNTNWQRFTGTMVLPNVNSKVLGSNGDDALQIHFNMPLNSIGTVDICNVQLLAANTVTDFEYLTQDQEFKRLNSQVDACLFYTGDFKFTLATIAPVGWLLCDDGTLGDPASGATHAAYYTKACLNSSGTMSQMTTPLFITAMVRQERAAQMLNLILTPISVLP
jgi:hypothetical protein